MANDTSVSGFCTGAGHLGINQATPPAPVRQSERPAARAGLQDPPWAAGRQVRSGLAALRRHKFQFGLQIRSSGDRTDRQIAYRRISPPTGLDPVVAVDFDFALAGTGLTYSWQQKLITLPRNR